MIQIDRRHFMASLGGVAAVKLMSAEAKAEALESYMMQQLNAAAPANQNKKFPKAAEIEAQIETARGVENASAIAAVPGVDALFLGPADLSQSLGIPGECLLFSSQTRQGVEETRERIDGWLAAEIKGPR